MTIIQKDYDWKDDPVKNAEIERIFAQAMQDIGEKLKTIIKQYNDTMSEGQLGLEQTSKDENEGMPTADEQLQGKVPFNM